MLFGTKVHPYKRAPATPTPSYSTPAQTVPWEQLQEQQLKGRRHLDVITTTPTTPRPPRVINYGPCKPSRRPGGGRGGHKHRHRGPKPTAPSGGGRRTHHDARHNFAIAKHLPKVISYDRPTNGSRAGHGIWRVTSSPTTGAPGKHAARMQPVAYLRSLFLVCCLPVRLPVCHRLFSSNFPCRDAVVVCGHVRRKSIASAASNSTVHCFYSVCWCDCRPIRFHNLLLFFTPLLFFAR